MSAIDMDRAAGAFHPAPFTRLLAAWSAWRDAQATRKALYRLSDRELDDIGLCRFDIERVARHG